MKPKFILGVGAQKAGTTWLRAILQRQPNVNLGFIKEFHIWDAKFSPLCSGYKANSNKPDKPGNALRRLMQTDSDIYGKYFKSLINQEVTITGDITPSYSLLKPQDFSHINDLLESFGFDIKVIFLMRDPIERIWSALRMHQRDLKKQGGAVTNEELIDRLIPSLGWPQFFERSNYAATINNLMQVFSSEQIHFDFYENLFNRESINTLEDFIDAKISNVDFETRLNPSKPITIPMEIIEKAKEILKPQYDTCYEKFPITIDIWR